MAGSTNSVVHWADLYAITWKPFMQFWFLYALFLTQITALLLYRHKTLLVAVAVVAYACHNVAPGILGDACFHLPFLVIGMLLADLGALTRQPGIAPTATVSIGVPELLTAGFVLLVAGSGLVNDLNPVAWTAFPASFFAIALLLWIARDLRGNAAVALRLLGQASMTIYVLHTIAGSATRIMLVKLGIASAPLLHLVAGTAAGLLVPLCIHYGLKHFKLLPWLGLAMVRRQAPRWALAR